MATTKYSACRYFDKLSNKANAEVQNSTAVFQLNISNKTSICASISRPNAKPQNVGGQLKKRQKRNEEIEKMIVKLRQKYA